MTLPRLVSTPSELDSLVGELGRCSRIGVDVEADGLFSYRAKLCVIQVAWQREGDVEVAVVDPLTVDVTPLAGVLGATGPLKILHDLTFDARMLAEAGVTLGHIHDTSVAARFLGEPATGLQKMVESRLGVVLSKALQEHNWSERPLSELQLEYLVGDVRHLLALADALEEQAKSLGIEAEIAIECDYKLSTALGPPKDARPAHARIKGAGELDPVSRTVLRTLVEARERLAEEADVPAFRIARNDLLLSLARRKPTSLGDLRRTCGRDRAARYATSWKRAIDDGLAAPPEPAPPPEPPPADLEARRKAERALTAWRRDRAAERGVDPQVVVPGHCMADVVSALLRRRHENAELVPALARIPGFGEPRIARYGDRLTEALAESE